VKGCMWCVDDGQDDSLEESFSEPCSDACYEELLDQAEREYGARIDGPSCADERAQQDELQRRVK
jgi:hypothetical protein